MKWIVLVSFACGVLFVSSAYTQFGAGSADDWATSRMNAQRTSWKSADEYISVANMQKPGFTLQWKRKLSNDPRQMNSLISAISVGARFSPLSVLSGSSNNLIALDNDTGAYHWTKHFDVSNVPAGSQACPGGMTAGATRTAELVLSAPVSRGSGRARASYHGVVGQPGEGVPAATLQRPPRPPRPQAARGPAAGRGPNASALAARFVPEIVYAVSSDGVLHSLGQLTGVEVQKPVPFLPPNAQVSELIAINNVVYAATEDGCSGVPNAVWSINLASPDKTVSSWKSDGGSPVGAPAFGTDGTLYIAIGGSQASGTGYSDAVVALDGKTLKVKDWFTQPNADFSSTPVVLSYNNQETVAAATRDGRVFLLDSKSLGGGDHKTPLYVSPAYSNTAGGYAPAALASWQDAQGTRWVLEPFAGSAPAGLPTTNGAVSDGGVLALRVVTQNGKPALQPGWVSLNMVSPLAPIVVDGVVFAASSGEYRPADSKVSVAERVRQSKPAVLYALDGTTGKVMWNSGEALDSFVHSTGIWTTTGQVYVATHDNTVYAFGFPMGRYFPGQNPPYLGEN